MKLVGILLLMVGLAWAAIDVFNEVPSGTINGINKSFTLRNRPLSGSVRIYRNGLRLKDGVDYTRLNSTITFKYIPQPGDILLVDYQR